MNKKILVIGIAAIFLLLSVSSVSATWCDNNYGKKAPVFINNTGGTAQTHYQIDLNITHDSDMNTTFDDIRVYNESDCSLIPLWNESAVASSWNKIWFNATSISASSWCNDTYYLYYDYSSASSATNIGSTFVFGDDFSVGPSEDAWTRYSGNPFLSSTNGEWDYGLLCKPEVLYNNNEYKLYYYGASSDPNTVPRKIGMANGTDGYSFTKRGVVLEANISSNDWDNLTYSDPTIMYHDGYYWLFYGGSNYSEAITTGRVSIGLAKSTNGINFTKITNGIDGTSKVLERGSSGNWDHTVTSPSAIVYYDSYFWLYYWGRPINANDDMSIGLAKSTDGVNFTKITNGISGTSKVLTTDGTSAEGKGVFRPSIFRYDNKWHMFYIRVHTDNSKRIGYAYSTDGVNWTKSSNNPVLSIGTDDWENDYLPGVSVIFKEGNESKKCIMYYQGAYISSSPTNRLGIANQTIKDDWDGSASEDCKWTFSNTDAITIEDNVMKIKAVTGGQNAYVTNKPILGDNFVQEFDYKPTAGYTYYGVTSIGTTQTNTYGGGIVESLHGIMAGRHQEINILNGVLM